MSKVKKTFEKPGQTMEHDETTADGPAVKIFYETLLQQRPDSAMAAEWLMKRGLLKDDVAKTWLKQLGKDKKGLTASKPALKRKVRPKGRLHPMTTATPGQLVGSLEHFRADLRLHSDCRHLPTISTRVQLERGRVRRRRRKSRRRRRPLLRQTPVMCACSTAGMSGEPMCAGQLTNPFLMTAG